MFLFFIICHGLTIIIGNSYYNIDTIRHESWSSLHGCGTTSVGDNTRLPALWSSDQHNTRNNTVFAGCADARSSVVQWEEEWPRDAAGVNAHQITFSKFFFFLFYFVFHGRCFKLIVKPRGRPITTCFSALTMDGVDIRVGATVDINIRENLLYAPGTWSRRP